MKKSILIVFALFIASCSVDKTEDEGSSDVFGTWRITEEYNLSYWGGYSSQKNYELYSIDSYGQKNNDPLAHIGEYGIIEGEYFDRNDPGDVSVIDTYEEWTFGESLFISKTFSGNGTMIGEPYETDHIHISDSYHEEDKVYTSIGVKHGHYVVLHMDSDNLHLFYSSYWSDPRSKFIFLEKVGK